MREVAGGSRLRRLEDREEMFRSAREMARRAGAENRRGGVAVIQVNEYRDEEEDFDNVEEVESEDETSLGRPDYLQEVPQELKSFVGSPRLVRRIPAADGGGSLYGCVCAHIYGHTYHRAMRRRVHLLMANWFHRFYAGFVTFGDRDRPFSVTVGVGDGAIEKVFFFNFSEFLVQFIEF